MNAFNPDHWVLIQPEIYFFFFLTNRNGSKRSTEALNSLDGLRKLHTACVGMRIGEASGSLLVDISEAGEIDGMPIGEALVQAQRSAHDA
jgi:hypothetical protein